MSKDLLGFEHHSVLLFCLIAEIRLEGEWDILSYVYHDVLTNESYDTRVTCKLCYKKKHCDNM